MLALLAVASLAFVALVQARTSLEGRLVKQVTYQSLSGRGDAESYHPRPIDFSPNDRVELNFGQIKTFIDPETGVWRVPNLENGKYIVSVDSQNVDYGYYLVEVKDSSLSYFRYNITSREKYPVKDFSAMKPFGSKNYFEIRQPFNIEGLIKSPTGIIIGITVLMMFCMKSMPSQDELRKMQQTEKSNGAPRAPVQQNS